MPRKQTAAIKEQKATKSTAKTTAVAKVEQPHGGALNAGGTPGNKGGGRRPDAVRQLATDVSYDEVIPVMREIVKDTMATRGERISAGKSIMELVPRKDEADPWSSPAFQEAARTFSAQERAKWVDAISRHAPEALQAILADVQANPG